MIRVNHQIRAPKIRVVLEDGGMLGVMSPQEALREGERRGLDLVEISPKATPPVCKLMDYGKFKYELKKKSHTGKKVASSVLKEITLSPQTDVHDLNFKMKNSIGFLEEGHRVKITIRFRGREMAHPEIGRRQMEKVLDALKNHGAPEGSMKMEGKMLMAMFVPLTPGVKKAKAQEAAAPVTPPLNPLMQKPIQQKRAEPIKAKV
ncbi:MAG: translation initiation factor [Bacteriovoracaceae bacterium]|nr:translation initiation factor [Bacteriovoracaceae bacterium]